MTTRKETFTGLVFTGQKNSDAEKREGVNWGKLPASAKDTFRRLSVEDRKKQFSVHGKKGQKLGNWKMTHCVERTSKKNRKELCTRRYNGVSKNKSDKRKSTSKNMTKSSSGGKSRSSSKSKSKEGKKKSTGARSRSSSKGKSKEGKKKSTGARSRSSKESKSKEGKKKSTGGKSRSSSKGKSKEGKKKSTGGKSRSSSKGKSKESKKKSILKDSIKDVRHAKKMLSTLSKNTKMKYSDEIGVTTEILDSVSKQLRDIQSQETPRKRQGITIQKKTPGIIQRLIRIRKNKKPGSKKIDTSSQEDNLSGVNILIPDANDDGPLDETYVSVNKPPSPRVRNEFPPSYNDQVGDKDDELSLSQSSFKEEDDSQEGEEDEDEEETETEEEEEDKE